MTTNILLLGAGFSRTWGGWLADEAFEFLLGSKVVQEDPELVALLWKHRQKGGFEYALEELQFRAENDDTPERERRLQSLQGAVSEMFSVMNTAFLSSEFAGTSGFEFSNDLRFNTSSFLIRFDAIFTLNQDVLLERHYLRGALNLLGGPRWNGGETPGVPLPSFPEAWDVQADSAPLVTVGEPRTTTRSKFQPCFKLHGSSNWRTNDDSELLVIGGAKRDAIEQHPILEAYYGEFRRRLVEPDCRLMVIGYSFRDEHINDAIELGAKQGLKIFIVDPEGTGVLQDRGEYVPDPVLPEPSIIGASRRGLRALCGGDPVEHSKLQRFFES